jgi:hypothetical protein
MWRLFWGFFWAYCENSRFEMILEALLLNKKKIKRCKNYGKVGLVG